MIQILLLTRGGLADEWLRATAGMRGCPAEGFETLTLAWNSECEADRAHVRNKISSMRREGPVLVLTDLLGSTQSNLAAELTEAEDVAVVAGANLAMVLRLACDNRNDRSLDELAEWISEKGRAAIRSLNASCGDGA